MTIAEQRFLESVPSRLMEIEKELSELNKTMAAIAMSMSKAESTKENIQQQKED